MCMNCGFEINAEDSVESSEEMKFSQVIFAEDPDGRINLSPESVSVKATVLEQIKNKKVIIFKKNRGKGYRRKEDIIRD